MSREGHAALCSAHQEYDWKENVLYRHRTEKKSDVGRHVGEPAECLLQLGDAGCSHVRNSLPKRFARSAGYERIQALKGLVAHANLVIYALDFVFELLSALVHGVNLFSLLGTSKALRDPPPIIQPHRSTLRSVHPVGQSRPEPTPSPP